MAPTARGTTQHVPRTVRCYALLLLPTVCPVLGKRHTHPPHAASTCHIERMETPRHYRRHTTGSFIHRRSPTTRLLRGYRRIERWYGRLFHNPHNGRSLARPLHNTHPKRPHHYGYSIRHCHEQRPRARGSHRRRRPHRRPHPLRPSLSGLGLR
jgi:hypothetical protein